MEQQQQQRHDTIEVYPIKEEADTNNKYKGIIKSDTIFKLLDLSDNANGPTLKAAHNYLVRRKEEIERNKMAVISKYRMTKKEIREHEEQQSFEKTLGRAAEEVVDRTAVQNEEQRPMF
jgi:hypothetical protein